MAVLITRTFLLVCVCSDSDDMLRAAMAYSAVDEGIDDAYSVRGDDVRGR